MYMSKHSPHTTDYIQAFYVFVYVCVCVLYVSMHTILGSCNLSV